MIRANFIRTTILASTLLAVVAAPAMAQQAPQPPTLTVFGDGIATAVPDIAVVTLGVVSEAPTAKDALAANATDMTAVISAITDAGIATKDIATSGLSVNPVYSDPSKDPEGRQQVTGYRVQNQVTVKIRDLAKSGPLLDKVVSAGANRVTGIDFDIDKAGALRDEAMKAAIAEARRKAVLMAEAAGVALGPIQSVQTSEGGGVPIFRAQMAMKADVSTPVMGGEQQISANATIVYIIEPLKK
ncbi:SIMPL domain-containing protein [Kaistia sp. 32K]|uniref:SIMPL domain-containing protein n=1 Tax=Kaistia sp. 32K TaxID=2795690 RepID=UPI0019169721|nr:SIMPL domain-containing protein [Kaistia sp. 32K]BCP54557.1 SIMPL domain-containing protein [Kaistia sp. 32K]